jgi:hypothetical protein
VVLINEEFRNECGSRATSSHSGRFRLTAASQPIRVTSSGGRARTSKHPDPKSGVLPIELPRTDNWLPLAQAQQLEPLSTIPCSVYSAGVPTLICGDRRRRRD